MVKITGSEEDKSTLQRYTLLLADHIYTALNQVEVNTIFDQTYLDLLRRIRASLFGLASQLPLWPAVHEMKVPIELLFRTMLNDALTLLYLATFDESETSFSNELSLLDTGVIKYLEAYIDNYELIDESVTEIDKKTRKESLYSMVPHLRVGGNVLQAKTPTQIRENSDLNLFLSKSKDAGFKSKLTEVAMFEQLKAHPATKDLAYLYIYQRLFSQTHHYARYNRNYTDWTSSHVCLNWFIALGGIYNVVGIAIGLLGTNEETMFRVREDRVELTKYTGD